MAARAAGGRGAVAKAHQAEVLAQHLDALRQDALVQQLEVAAERYASVH